MLPNYLTDVFTNTSETHDYNTRQSKFSFALPMPNANDMKKAFAYRGAGTWNNLPVDLKSTRSTVSLALKLNFLVCSCI